MTETASTPKAGPLSQGQPWGPVFPVPRPANAALQRCPECHSIIYCRRHPICGRCGRRLPAAALFSRGEAARVIALLDRERQLHRRWLQRNAEALRSWLALTK